MQRTEAPMAHALRGPSLEALTVEPRPADQHPHACWPQKCEERGNKLRDLPGILAHFV
jgi:hypothetical protein